MRFQDTVDLAAVDKRFIKGLEWPMSYDLLGVEDDREQATRSASF